MPAKLDRSRPYGTVHGSDTGTCYEQDYKEFDHDGQEIVKAGASGRATAAAPAGTAGPVATITKDGHGNLMADGAILDTEAMEAEDLRALAGSMGLRLHPMTGKAKALIAITDAAAPADELAKQLAG